MSYFNTTNETGETLTENTKKATAQDQVVLEVAKNLDGPFSASKILFHFPKVNVPITSIRRAINTLCKKGKVVKTGNRVKGMFNRSELQYKISE